MTIYIGLPLLVCVVGVVVYAIASTEKPKEIGRIMFFTGLLAFLLRFSSVVIGK